MTRDEAQVWLTELTHRQAVRRLLPESRTIVDVGHSRLQRLLRTLTPIQRQVFVAAYLEGRTSQEVANQFGLTVANVQNLFRDGLIRLRDCLELDTIS